MTETGTETRKKLFDTYHALEAAVTEKTEEIEKVRKSQAEIALAIKEHFGSGPFRVEGKLMKVSKRKGIYLLREITVEDEE
jgi:ERCC4-type nuclease